MPKREKEKKPAANAAILTNLAEERVIVVYLMGYTEVDAMQDVMVLLKINNEQHCIRLRDAVKEAQADTHVSDDRQAAPLPQLLPLSQQLVRVGDAAVRDTLLNHREANRIAIYSVLAADAGGDARTGRRLSRGTEKINTAAGSAGAKEKSQTAKSGSHTTPPEGARCIGGASLSLIPLLTNTSMDVTIRLSTHVAAAEMHFRVCCRESPLLTQEEVLKYRPVVLRIGGVEGLPPVRTESLPVSKDGAETGTVASSRILRAHVQLGTAYVLTPALSVVTPFLPTTSTTNAPTSTAPADQSLSLDKTDTPVHYHEHVLFLNMMGSVLDVYRQLYSTPCKVSLWQSFNANSSEKVSFSSLKGPLKMGKAETLLGSGGFSVRDFLSDDQLRFSELVQLLPDRSTVGLAGGQTCLTTASTIKVTLDFFRPFPPLQHVDSTGAALNRKAFLTHAIIRLPYQSSWMVDCLELLLQEITSFPHATEDVETYTSPPPSPSSESQDGLKRPISGGRTSGNAGLKTAAPGVGNRSSKKPSKVKGGLKADTGAASKVASRAGVPPSPEPVAALPTHRFDAPLRLVSPPGLSGFEVADGKERVWCLEGTVPEVHHVITRLTTFLEEHQYAHTAASMLFNAELFVPARAYLSFPALVTLPTEFTTTTLAVPDTDPAAAATATSPSPAVGAMALEVEPSGTGGRFHRIRLRTTLGELCQTQTHYVRHILSDECFDCLNCLSALLRAASMREVEARGLLPSAKLLIALERSFGQTLEKDDLYGAPSLPCSTSATTPSAHAGRPTDDGESPLPLSRSSIMDKVPVGTLVFFDGSIKTGRGPRRPIPAAAQQRFPVTAWMVVTDTGEEVLCAFAHSAPTGLVQYHVEGQVVQAADVTLLYVLQCVCLARSFTHSHNVEYEQLLRERQRTQQLRLMQRTALWTKNKGPSATHTKADGRPLHRTQQHIQQTGHAVAALTPGERAQKVSEESSGDEAEGDDWLASDFYDHLDPSPSSNDTHFSAVTTMKDWRNAHARR